MDLLEFIIKHDEEKKLQTPLVAYILKDLMETSPLILPTLMGCKEVLEKGEVFDPRYQEATSLMKDLMGCFRDSQSALISMIMAKEESKIGVNSKGEVVLVLEEEEVVVS